MGRIRLQNQYVRGRIFEYPSYLFANLLAESVGEGGWVGGVWGVLISYVAPANSFGRITPTRGAFARGDNF